MFPYLQLNYIPIANQNIGVVTPVALVQSLKTWKAFPVLYTYKFIIPSGAGAL